MKKNLFRLLLVIAGTALSALIVTTLILYNGLAPIDKAPVSDTGAEDSEETHSSLNTTDNGADSPEEMRGIWLPYMCLTLSPDEQNESAFRRKACGILDKCSACGLNTVIMQVRPFSDALYKSKLFPWSHILTGTQGKDPGFDPLAIMTEEAHKRGLALHAWINPLRISTGNTPRELSEDNPYIKWQKGLQSPKENYFFEYQGGLYYDPSSKNVRALIAEGVRELVSSYDIDGVQIDDYFYPTEDESIDLASYEEYKSAIPDGSKPLSHQEWRKNNINSLICMMYMAVHSDGKDIEFGIAPQCNFDNDERMAADIRSWCSFSGYADYICPQLYVSNQHPVFPFRRLADEWCSAMKNEKTKLYFGLALYKVGTDEDSGTWLTSEDIIKSQIDYLRSHSVGGFILYSYEYIDNYG